MPCSAATVSRKRAMATANGLRSTPWIASSAACTRACDFQAGGLLVPPVQEPVEGAEQEVARPAGRVDQLEAFERPFLQCRFQGPVEDELLDEHRGLQQRVGLLRVLGQVLVQVAEEAGGQRRCPPGRGRARRPRRGVARSRAALVDRITGRRDQVQRGMRVDQRLASPATARGGRSPSCSHSRSVSSGWVRKNASWASSASCRRLLRPGDPDRLHQRVVLAEPDEHGGQHPRDRGLGDPVVAPGDPGRRRALLIQGPLVLLLPAPLQLSVGRDPGPQVVFQEQDLPLEVRGEAPVSRSRCPSP